MITNGEADLPIDSAIRFRFVRGYDAGNCAWPDSIFRMKRFAALVSRRFWIRTSSTNPSWSTARHRKCRSPLIVTTASSRCHMSPRRGVRRRTKIGILPSELFSPFAYRHVGNDNRSISQHVFNHAKAQWEAGIQLHRFGDNLRRKTMAVINRGTRFDHDLLSPLSFMPK